MVLRHHNEAESLNAVQKMDWEWKIAEISNTGTAGGATSGVGTGCATAATGGGPSSGTSSSAGSSAMNRSVKVDDLYVPMVHVSDDFDLSDNR